MGVVEVSFFMTRGAGAAVAYFSKLEKQHEVGHSSSEFPLPY